MYVYWINLQYWQDVIRWLENDFPKGSELSALELQREAHDAFADAPVSSFTLGERNISKRSMH